MAGGAVAQPTEEEIEGLPCKEDGGQRNTATTSPPATAPARQAPATATAQRMPAAAGVLTHPITEIRGPKRVVAVAKFDAVGSFNRTYGGWELGGGLSAMLVTALIESGRVTVVERANLQSILNEKQLTGAGLSTPGSGPAVAGITGVNFILVGSVVSFGAANSGGGFSIGLGGNFSGVGNIFGGASRQTIEGDVTIQVRVIDATTTEVIETHTVKEEVDASSWSLTGGYQGIALGTNQFYRTPLGEASRRAITRIVQKLAILANRIPWSGLVVEYDGWNLYVNAGREAGLKPGDVLYIERVGKTFTDPQTGAVLGVRRSRLGSVTINNVEPKMGSGQFVPLSATGPVPQRGDRVVIGG